MTQVSETIGQTWDRFVGSQTPQEFMDISRQGQPGITIEQAIAQYVAEIPSMFGVYHEVEDEETGETEMVEWSQDELNDIGQSLIAYLERSEGEEWN